MIFLYQPSKATKTVKRKKANDWLKFYVSNKINLRWGMDIYCTKVTVLIHEFTEELSNSISPKFQAPSIKFQVTAIVFSLAVSWNLGFETWDLGLS